MKETDFRQQQINDSEIYEFSLTHFAPQPRPTELALCIHEDRRKNKQIE